jgi:hypothetical protein
MRCIWIRSKRHEWCRELLRLRNCGDGTLRSDNQHAAFGIGAGGVEGEAKSFIASKTARVGGRAKIKNEIFADDKNPLRGDWLHANFLAGCLSRFFLRKLANGFFVDPAVIGYGGEVGEGMEVGECPGLASVFRESEIRAIILGMFVIASGDYTVGCVAKGDGEDSGGVRSMQDRSVVDLPGLSAVGRVEDAGRLAPSGEPDVEVGLGTRIVRREERDTGVRRGEGSFAFNCVRKLCRRDGMPRLTVVGEQELELEPAGIVGNGVADDDAVFGIPECHGIEESFGIGVGELQLPVLSAVGGVVDAGLVAGTGGHQKSLVGGEGNDRAEIEVGSIRNLGRFPRTSVIQGAKISAVGAAGPCDVARHGGDPAEVFGRVRDLDARAGLGNGARGKEKQEQRTHEGIVAEIRRKEIDVRLVCNDAGNYNSSKAPQQAGAGPRTATTIIGIPLS